MTKDLDEITSLVYSTEIRDFYTQGHSEHVAYYAHALAEHMGLSQKECEDIYIAGLLHDVGKIGIPDSVLLKPGRLEKDEYDLIKLHSAISGKIVAKLPNFSYLEKIVRYHHEDYNGKGYPDGLKGEEIPLASRILSIVDVFDALTTGRIYRASISFEQALSIMADMQKGEKFDPKIYEVFIPFIKQLGIYKGDQSKKIAFRELEEKRNEFFFVENLTHLLNRTALLSLLRKAHDYENSVSLIVCNIKAFKIYNKRNGLNAGDELLKRVAVILKTKLHAITSMQEPVINTLFLFRITADKFVVLYNGTKSEFLAYKLQIVAEDVLKKFATQFEYTFLLQSTKVQRDIEEEIGYML